MRHLLSKKTKEKLEEYYKNKLANRKGNGSPEHSLIALPTLQRIKIPCGGGYRILKRKK